MYRKGKRKGTKSKGSLCTSVEDMKKKYRKRKDISSSLISFVEKTNRSNISI